MSVIIRLQNLPWSANALDIRNFFRGLSIPEGGVHIVGGELGDAFIAFSTDEDARQAMMLDGGKIKEIQVKLLLSSRSEMHKVIEAARQSVPLMALAPTPAPPPVVPAAPAQPSLTPFAPALGTNHLTGFGIPGIGNPQEIPQPAVIEPPILLASPPIITTPEDNDDRDRRSKEKDRRRSRSRSRSRDRKDRKRDRRDRSRSRERRRRDRDRSRSRERRDRKRDRKDRSRSRGRSPRRSRDRRNSPPSNSEKSFEGQIGNGQSTPQPMFNTNMQHPMHQMGPGINQNGPGPVDQNRFEDPSMNDAFSKLQELGKKRNPNAFQGEQPNNNGGRFGVGRGGMAGPRGGMAGARGGAAAFRRDRDGPRSRFDPDQRDCCVAIRNAPNHTSYGDVRRFFPYMIDKHGIKMINDNMGRRTGNIFVRFCDSRSKHLALQRKSNELKGAQVIVEELDDQAYESAVDSFLPFRADNDEEEPSLIIADNEPVSLPPFSVLRLTDLPNYVKEHDIVKTFSDLSLLSIMLNDCRTTRSKIAYVQFAKPEDAKLAFDRKERYIFGRRHPTITPITNDEYEREKTMSEITSQQPGKPNDQIEVEVPPRDAGMPRDPRQRRQFDNGGGGPQPAPPQQIGGPQQSQFFPTPQFVQGQQFGAPFAAPAQFGGFPAGNMDPRTAAANWANRPGFPNQQGPNLIQNQNPIIIDDDPLECVLMKGLPPDATDRTIVKFFGDTGAVPARIHLMLDPNGMPSGDCFCEFRSPQEARLAASKHGQDLDGCRITVDPVARTVVEEALEGPKPPEIPDVILGNVPQQFFDAPRGGGFGPRPAFRGRGSFDRGGFDRGGFDRGGYRGGFDSNRSGFDSNRGGFDSNRGGFESNRGGFDLNRSGFDSQRGKFDSNRGFRGRGGFNERGGRFDRGRGRGFGRGGRGGHENGRTIGEEEPDPELEDFGSPGCVVSMENVPYRATVDDITSFFSEFELTQDDIIRRFNERGQPTGDARVAFRTPFDAQRAVKTRHMDIMHDRRINLTIL